MDQSSRYAALDLAEDRLIAEGRHVLAAYAMRPKRGDYLTAAAHFAAESSTGTNVEVGTTDDFTRAVDALVYEADPASGIMKLAFPIALFDRNITDGKAILSSFLTLTVGNNQGMGDIAHAKLLDFYAPPAYLGLFDGPAANIEDLRRVLGRPAGDAEPIVGTIVKPKLGLRPEPFAEACREFWSEGDFVKNDEPQGNQPFAPLAETMRAVAQAMARAQDETGTAKLFSANVTADDPAEIVARGETILEIFGENASHVAFLVDGFLAGPAAVSCVRRTFPNQFLHYHRAGHGAITSPQSQRGYTALVLMKLARMIGASGIHVGTLGVGKMEGDASDRTAALMLDQPVAEGLFFRQDWIGMKATTPIVSGGMNALRLPMFFDRLGHANVIQTCGGGVFGHLDGPAAGARSLRQAVQAWRQGIDPVRYALEHRELARAFASFPEDADALYPGWRTALPG